MNNFSHSLTGGYMLTPDTTPSLQLSPDPRGNYVTWKEGKRQIRNKLKAAGFRIHGHFRMRKEARNEFQCIAVKDNKTFKVNADRKPNATFTFTHIG